MGSFGGLIVSPFRGGRSAPGRRLHSHRLDMDDTIRGKHYVDWLS